MKCRDANVYPKFVRYKNVKNKHKVKNRYYHRILLDEITTKNRSIRNLRQLDEAESALHEFKTYHKKHKTQKDKKLVSQNNK